MHSQLSKILTPWQPRLCFVHIPKTGGTSIRFYLRDLVGKRRILWANGPANREKWNAIDAKGIRKLKVIGGHVEGPDFRRKLPENVRFAAVVRSPVERSISHFNFIVNPRNPKRNHALKAELKHFGLDRGVFESVEFIRTISNTQCRFICGKPSAKEAIAVLENQKWIADTIHNVEFVAREITTALAINSTVEFPHANSRLKPPARIKDRTLHRIEELNQEDTILYEYVAGISRPSI